MKQAIITSGLVGLLFGATACYADDGSVTVYGAVDLYARHATNGAAGGQSANMLDDGGFYASRLGFKASEDLGDGLRAIMALEMGFDPSTGGLEQISASPGYGQAAATSGRAFGRTALVGLSGSYGTLTLGRQYTIAHILSGHFQPQSNPNQPSLNILSIYHVARQDNMIKYVDNIGPVGISTSYTLSEGNGKSDSVGASYVSGPIDLVAYWEQMDSNAAGTDKRTVYGAGGNYKLWKGLTGYLGGMRRTQTASAVRNDVVTGGLLYNLTALTDLTLGATNDRQGQYGTVASGRREMVFASAEYHFSKRTSVYVEADNTKVNGGYTLPSFMGIKGSQTGLELGMDHRF